MCNIELRYSNEQVFVRDREGEMFSIIAASSDTVEQVREKILKKTGIPPNKYRLFCRGKQLDGKTVNHPYEASSNLLFFYRFPNTI